MQQSEGKSRMCYCRIAQAGEAGFFNNLLEAVEDAIHRHGKPEIFNTDQGSQFTSEAFTGLLA